MAYDYPMPTALNDRAVQMLQQAAQYYLAGRYSVICGFVPVPALLFHHGLEMALKAVVLCHNPHLSDTDANKYLKHSFHHDLVKLWREFMRLYPNEQLADLTDLVERLDQFEDVRYPDFQQAYLVSILINHDDGPPFTTDRSDIKNIFVCLEDVDVLMKRVWEVCAFPITLFQGYGPPHGYFLQTAYYCNNLHPLYHPTFELTFLPYSPGAQPDP